MRKMTSQLLAGAALIQLPPRPEPEAPEAPKTEMDEFREGLLRTMDRVSAAFSALAEDLRRATAKMTAFQAQYVAATATHETSRPSQPQAPALTKRQRRRKRR